MMFSTHIHLIPENFHSQVDADWRQTALDYQPSRSNEEERCGKIHWLDHQHYSSRRWASPHQQASCLRPQSCHGYSEARILGCLCLASRSQHTPCYYILAPDRQAAILSLTRNAFQPSHGCSQDPQLDQ